MWMCTAKETKTREERARGTEKASERAQHRWTEAAEVLSELFRTFLKAQSNEVKLSRKDKNTELCVNLRVSLIVQMSRCCYSSPWQSTDSRLVFKPPYQPYKTTDNSVQFWFPPPSITSCLSVCQTLSMRCVQTAEPHLDQWNICVVFSFHFLSPLLLGLFICCLITSHVLVFHQHEGGVDAAERGTQFSRISGTCWNSLFKWAESWCVSTTGEGLVVNLQVLIF